VLGGHAPSDRIRRLPAENRSFLALTPVGRVPQRAADASKTIATVGEPSSRLGHALLAPSGTPITAGHPVPPVQRIQEQQRFNILETITVTVTRHQSTKWLLNSAVLFFLGL